MKAILGSQQGAEADFLLEGHELNTIASPPRWMGSAELAEHIKVEVHRHQLNLASEPSLIVAKDFSEIDSYLPQSGWFHPALRDIPAEDSLIHMLTWDDGMQGLERNIIMSIDTSPDMGESYHSEISEAAFLNSVRSFVTAMASPVDHGGKSGFDGIIDISQIVNDLTRAMGTKLPQSENAWDL
jgi:hypothetical protein